MGEVVNIIATQNVRIIRYPQRFHGRGPGGEGQARYRQQKADQAMDALRSLPAGRKRALLTHKPLAELIKKTYADSLEKMEADVGWWGAHEKGHNEWTGRHLVIFGGNFLTTEEQAGKYESARIFALTCGASPEDWPAFSDEVTEGEWVCEGDHDVQSIARLPADQKIRGWLLRDYTAAMVQAVGRVRGVWMLEDDPCEIRIFGGLPIWGLGEYGLSINEYRLDPAGWRTLESHNRAQGEDARARFLVAVEGLEAVGAAVTFRGMNGFLRASGRAGLSAQTYARLRGAENDVEA